MITLEDVIKNEEVQAFVNASQKQLEALGYTEHSNRHIGIVSKRTGEILTKLGFDVYVTPEYEHNTYLVVCKAKNLWFAQSCEINKTFIEYAKLEFKRIERENNLFG